MPRPFLPPSKLPECAPRGWPRSRFFFHCGAAIHRRRSTRPIAAHPSRRASPARATPARSSSEPAAIRRAPVQRRRPTPPSACRDAPQTRPHAATAARATSHFRPALCSRPRTETPPLWTAAASRPARFQSYPWTTPRAVAHAPALRTSSMLQQDLAAQRGRLQRPDQHARVLPRRRGIRSRASDRAACLRVP